MTAIVFLFLVLVCFQTASGFVPTHHVGRGVQIQRGRFGASSRIWQSPQNPEQIAEKYGLEAGIVSSMSNGDNNEQKVKPKDLLAKYGIAYLATSITLAIISYATCYVLVSNGVDVGAVLERVGIRSTAVASNAGTVAIAYAMHKAASPIRFPPTVALTPIVARWIGRKSTDSDRNSKGDSTANTAK